MFAGAGAHGASLLSAGLVMGQAEIKAPNSKGYEALESNMTVALGSSIRTGADGEVEMNFSPYSRIVLQSGSEVEVAGATGGSERVVGESSSGTASAIKSLYTHNDSVANVTKTVLPGADLSLGRGSSISEVEQGRQRIDLPATLGGYVYATGGSFVTTVESPKSARVTVHSGFVTLGLPNGQSVPVAAGEYARLVKARNRDGFELIGPAPIANDELASADGTYFDDQGGKKSLLPPIAEFIDDPASQSVSGVGSGLSAPFDLVSTRRASRLSSPPNPSNVLPPVVCPNQ